MAPISVAIIGGSGNLGRHLRPSSGATRAGSDFPSVGSLISKTFLSEDYFNKSVGRVLILTRDSTSERLKDSVALGAEVVQIGDTITAEDLDEMDVVISALGLGAPDVLRDSCAKTASGAGAKVYFLNEFGM